MKVKNRQNKSMMIKVRTVFMIVCACVCVSVGGWLLTGIGHRGTFWADGNVLHLDLGSGNMGVSMCTFRFVQLSIPKLYLNLTNVFFKGKMEIIWIPVESFARHMTFQKPFLSKSQFSQFQNEGLDWMIWVTRRGSIKTALQSVLKNWRKDNKNSI